MDWYRPGAIVLQCGADSLAGDRLGCFNLSHRGHSRCVEYVKRFNIPLLVLGGGGYTIRNVSRVWAYETALLLDRKLPDELPFNDYFEYYGPDYTVTVPPSNMANQNTPEYLHKLKTRILENLRHMPFAPSLQGGTTHSGDMFTNNNSNGKENGEDSDRDEEEDDDWLDYFDFRYQKPQQQPVSPAEDVIEDDVSKSTAVLKDDSAMQALAQGAHSFSTLDLTAENETLLQTTTTTNESKEVKDEEAMDESA